jgi:hypothetical protein
MGPSRVRPALWRVCRTAPARSAAWHSLWCVRRRMLTHGEEGRMAAPSTDGDGWPWVQMTTSQVDRFES